MTFPRRPNRSPSDPKQKSASSGSPPRLRLLLGFGLALVLVAGWVWREPAELWFLRRGSVSGLESYQQQNPDSTAVTSALAEAYLRADRSQDAVRVLTPLVDRRPEDSELRTLLGRSLLAAGDTVHAYGQLKVVVETLHDTSADALWWLGQTEERLDHGDAAFACYQRVIQKAPRHVPALLRLAHASAVAEQFTEAYEYDRRALQADPRSEPAAAGLSEMEFRLGKLSEALTHARAAVKLQPQDSNANLWLGRALLAVDSQRYADEAEAAFRRSVEGSPQKYVPRLYLARLLRERGRMAEAESALEENVRENPLHEESYYELALCARALGHHDRATSALAHFRRLNRLSLESAQLESRVKVSPADPELRLRLARFFVRNGRPDLARPHVERLLRNHPGDRDALRLQEEIARHPEPTL